MISLDPISLAADMWSIGAITYVLMSGLSPFMGENDSETLTNVSNAEWDFDDGEGIFEQISDEGKRFIEELLILEPGYVMNIIYINRLYSAPYFTIDHYPMSFTHSTLSYFESQSSNCNPFVT